MSTNQTALLSLIELIACFAGIFLAGAIAGAYAVNSVKGKRTPVPVQNDDRLVIEKIDVNLVFRNGEEPVVQNLITYSNNELTSSVIEHWLESRGLMAQPRGVDFKVAKAPSLGG